jgi:hypothetical protein
LRLSSPLQHQARSLAVDARIAAVPAAREWFARCLEQLFASQQLTIESTAAVFPPAVSMRIRTPDAVLEERLVRPLEAALLLRALGSDFFRRRGVKVMLVTLPYDEEENSQPVYLAWTPGRGEAIEDWSALDMRHLNDQPFEANLQEATAHIQRFLTEKPVLARLSDEMGEYGGLFIDDPAEGGVALEFETAVQRSRIRALPGA